MDIIEILANAFDSFIEESAKAFKKTNEKIMEIIAENTIEKGGYFTLEEVEKIRQDAFKSGQNDVLNKVQMILEGKHDET